MRKKDRDISILEYFNVLQGEYVYFELRSKIYPSAEDKEYYREIMRFKASKIKDIAKKNNLDSIFNSETNLDSIRKEFFDDFGNPKRLGKRDWYFYYKIDSDFAYNGKGVKLKSYNPLNKLAVIEMDLGETREVSFDAISRIL